MSWKNVTLPAREAPPPQRTARAVSPPLMRFLGSVGFTAAGIGALYLGAAKLHIGHDLFDIPRWDAKVVLLFGLSLVAGLVGGVFGLSVGAAIQVRSERVDRAIGVLWHSFGNGTIISLFLWGLILTKRFGPDGLKRYVESVGRWWIGLWTVGFDAVACLLIGAGLLAAGAMRLGARPRWIPCFLVAMPVAAAAGYVQSIRLQLGIGLWLFKWLALSAGLVPIVAFMVERDRLERRAILDRYGGD